MLIALPACAPVQALLAWPGVKVDAYNDEGLTPLHIATYTNNTELVSAACGQHHVRKWLGLTTKHRLVALTYAHPAVVVVVRCLSGLV